MRVLSSTLYKDTTFRREIQIALTFRNTPRNVKMQRFAADGGWLVLYYEGRGGPCVCLGILEDSRGFLEDSRGFLEDSRGR